MGLNVLTAQVAGGLVLAALVLWQLAVGLRWIKLGRNQFRVHRYTGIALAVLVVPHMLQGFYIALGWFAPVFRAIYG